jgi:SAM-dependent methyltransferase
MSAVVGRPAPVMGTTEANGGIGCLACGASGCKPIFEAHDLRHGLEGSFHVAVCAVCGCGITYPPVVDPSQWYVDGYGNHAPRRSITDRVFERAVESTATVEWRGFRRRVIERFVPAADLGGYLRAGARLLDVGAGSGHAVHAFQRAGLDAWGVEPSQAAVEAAAAAGIPNVLQGVLPSLDPNHRDWDVIRFWHTLEHSDSPLDELVEARSRLAPGGRVVVGVPNFGGAGRRLFGSRWDGLEVPRHFTHFTGRSLRAVMDRAGLRVVSVRSVAVMGVLPASTGHRFGLRVLRGRAAQILGHAPELALAWLGVGEGLLAIATASDQCISGEETTFATRRR